MTFAQEAPAVRHAQISNVSLTNGGVLRGQVIDSQGKSVANAPVMISFAGGLVAKTTSNKNGLYSVKGLRGGLHHVVAGTNRSTVRLWSSSAPKDSRNHMLSVTGSVVRGQYATPTGYAPPMGMPMAPPMAMPMAPPLGPQCADGCPPGMGAPSIGAPGIGAPMGAPVDMGYMPTVSYTHLTLPTICSV